MSGEGVNVGDVESVLRLRDEFSDVFQKFLGMAPGMGESFKAIGEAAALMGVAIAAGIGVIVELGSHGSDVKDVGDGFVRLAGGAKQANDILTAMRSGVVGTISDFGLMTEANHLLAVGAVTSAQDFSTLTTASRDLAHEFGGNTKDMIDSMSMALETGRTRKLALMGVTVDTKAAEAEYAKSLGMTTSELDKGQKLIADRQAILQALSGVVKGAGDQEVTFAEKIQQGKVLFENFTNALSVAIATSPVLGAALDGVGAALKSAFGGNQTTLIDTIMTYVNKFAILVVDLGIGATQVATVFVAAWGAIRLMIDGTLSSLASVGSTFANVNASITEFASKHSTITGVTAADAAAAKDSAAQWSGYAASLHGAAEEDLAMVTGHSALNASIDKVAGGLMNVRDKMVELSAKTVDHTKAVSEMSSKHDVAAGSIHKLLDAQDTWAMGIAQLVDRMPHLNTHLDEMRTLFDEVRTTEGPLISYTNEFTDGLNRAGDEVTTVTIPMFSKLQQDVLPGMTKAIAAATKETASFSDELTGSLEKALNSMPDLLVKAFTGGGGLIGAAEALGAKFGGDLGKSLEKSLAGSLSDTFGKTLGGVIGAAIPAVGALVGPLIGMLANIGGPSKAELAGRQAEATFEQSFGGFQQMALAVSKAYDAQGKSAQQANTDVLAMFAAEKQGGDAAAAAVKKISDVINSQTQDTADLDAAIKKYGFSLAELGPTMQKQQLDAQAQTLLNDWRLLIGSGIDIVNVDTRMASSMQSYLTAAKQTGQEVPQAMQPIIQKMIDQGDLTDAAGNKITDMKDLGVTFSETMSQGFQSVVDKLQALIDKLPNLGIALSNATKPVPAPWSDWTAPPSYSPDSSIDPSGLPTFGPEVFVPSPRAAIVGTNGGEVVLHKSTYDQMMGGGGDMGSKLDKIHSALLTLPGTIARANRDAALIANA